MRGYETFLSQNGIIIDFLPTRILPRAWAAPQQGSSVGKKFVLLPSKETRKGDGHMLVPGKTYEKVYSSFRWDIPEFYNIGFDICDKWAHQRYRLALIYENEKGQVQQYTFWDLKRL
ncbi:MAG: hypothetical protein KAV87_42060, partial [Desulfobacteraceae bacterium]|nr:hypothetical protein [Desulfobacteraceae bacterium]